jgi:hypothetical protein
MSNAILEERFLEGGRGSQREGESEDPRPQQPFGWRHEVVP